MEKNYPQTPGENDHVAGLLSEWLIPEEDLAFIFRIAPLPPAHTEDGKRYRDIIRLTLPLMSSEVLVELMQTHRHKPEWDFLVRDVLYILKSRRLPSMPPHPGVH